MSHFRNKTSPLAIISIAYVYVFIVGIVLYVTGYYQNSTFFSWGPPIKFFGQDITDQKNFYMIHVLIFFHQLVNNCVNSIVYAWIINSVQDPKNKKMEYSRITSLIIINAFNVYSELDLVFIIAGFMSQISFVVTIILANMITSTYINDKYLREKIASPLLVDELQNYSQL